MMWKEKNQDVLLSKKPIIITLNYLLLLALVIMVLVPICIVLIQSFKSDQDYITSQVWDLPKQIHWENYLFVIEKGRLLTGFLNTNILAFGSLFGTVIMGTMVAYVLTRFQFPGKNLLLLAYVVAAMIPGTTTLIATFKVIQGLQLYNTIWAGLVLYLAAGVVEIYIFLQFASKIPTELDESAMIDGASYFQIYSKIILPQMIVAIVTISILKVTQVYNDMFMPFVFMPSSELNTLTTGLMKFSYDRNSQWNIMAAGIMTIMVPTLILYLFSQRYIVAGVSGGAVKG